MTKHQFLSICTWQRNTFGQATAMSKLHHLAEEFIELTMDLKDDADEEDVKKEFADCFILLFGAADSYGMSYEDICQAIDDKMNINYKRNWGKPDKNGVVNHIKDEDEADGESDFQPCDNCDLPDACEDFGCAIKQGIRKTVE